MPVLLQDLDVEPGLGDGAVVLILELEAIFLQLLGATACCLAEELPVESRVAISAGLEKDCAEVAAVVGQDQRILIELVSGPWSLVDLLDDVLEDLVQLLHLALVLGSEYQEEGSYIAA
jgi:hypothetical protein